MDRKNTLTGIHLKLIAVCDELGLKHCEEEQFGRFFIDVYLPEFHLGLEADGPYHLKKYDRNRDDELWELYQLPLARYHYKKMQTKEQMEEIKCHMLQEINHWAESANQRLQIAKFQQQLLD